MAEELKVPIMRRIERPRIHENAVDTVRSEGRYGMTDSIIKGRPSPVWKLVSVVYALDISCEGTRFKAIGKWDNL